jgi:hypothetical protein
MGCYQELCCLTIWRFRRNRAASAVSAIGGAFAPVLVVAHDFSTSWRSGARNDPNNAESHQPIRSPPDRATNYSPFNLADRGRNPLCIHSDEFRRNCEVAQNWRSKRFSTALNLGSARRLAKRGSTWRNGRCESRSSQARSSQWNASSRWPSPVFTNTKSDDPTYRCFDAAVSSARISRAKSFLPTIPYAYPRDDRNRALRWERETVRSKVDRFGMSPLLQENPAKIIIRLR